MSNVIFIHNPDAKKRIMEKETLQHERGLEEARHELNLVFLQRMQEDHHAVDLNRIMQIHDIANSVTRLSDICVLEGAIRDLKEMDPNYVPVFRRTK